MKSFINFVLIVIVVTLVTAFDLQRRHLNRVYHQSLPLVVHVLMPDRTLQFEKERSGAKQERLIVLQPTGTRSYLLVGDRDDEYNPKLPPGVAYWGSVARKKARMTEPELFANQ